MDFMTPASVRNLPNYLADDRATANARKEEERYTKNQQEKKMVAQFGMDLMSVLDSGGDVKAGLDGLKQKYSGKMTPEMMQLTSNMVQRFKQDQIAKQQMDQQNTIFEQGQQDRTDKREAATLLGKYAMNRPAMDRTGQGVGLISQGVPAEDAARMGHAEDGVLEKLVDNPYGVQSLLNYQDKQAEKKRQAVQDDLDKKNVLSQIKEREKGPEPTALERNYKFLEEQFGPDIAKAVTLRSGSGDNRMLIEKAKFVQEAASKNPEYPYMEKPEQDAFLKQAGEQFDRIVTGQSQVQPQMDFNKTYSEAQAQQMGARKGKDGKWYYPVGQGQYQPLNVAGNPEQQQVDDKIYYDMPKREQQ